MFEASGFVIIALAPSHSDYWDEKLNFGYKKVSEVFLDDQCTHFFAQELGLTELAIINTDYFGGIGEQEAVSYKDGNQTSLNFKGGINKALSTIGVKSSFAKDEFDTIGLSKYRNWDDFFEKYKDL